MENMEKMVIEYPLLKEIIKTEEVFWINSYKEKFEYLKKIPISIEEIEDAEARLDRFRPFLIKCFNELEKTDGIIESDLQRIIEMEKKLRIIGKLYLKRDSDLPVAGSIKARGGIYEVLKYTEKLAIENGLLKKGQSYSKLADEDSKKLFSNYTIQVGSTGNLGLSIGIISAKVGYEVIVHMSSDAQEWKKELLREKGVKVVEYKDDYSKAVQEGRKLSSENPNSYFIDDEKSMDLFLGYAVAAKRLEKQLIEKDIKVDKNNPLFVYLPCGVGGGPGGIAYGLKLIFKDNVHCFFAEPTHSPCMLIGMYTKTYDKYSVQNFGIDNKTIADGLAVGRASEFVSKSLINLLDGIYTVEDENLEKYLKALYRLEAIYLEPSACAGFAGVEKISNMNISNFQNATHIVWGTGGSLVPENIRKNYI